MNRCIRCNIKIEDATVSCPLCGGAVEQMDGETRGETGYLTSHSATYPDIRPAIRKMQLAIKIVFFASLLVESILLLINYLTYQGVWWSLVSAVGLIYANFTLMYAFQKQRSFQRIIQVEMIVFIIGMILIDKFTGSYGWSFDYSIPVTLGCVAVGMMVLMFVGIDQWQSYIMTEILTFLLSALFLLLDALGVIECSLFMLIAVALTGVILLGTIFFGERMVSNEIRRRFRV